MDTKINFTKTTIEGLLPPDQGRVTYHDSKQPGLQLRVSDKGTKTFCVRSSLHGKSIRVTLGRFPKITVEQARKHTKQHLSTLVTGKNPNALKRAERSVGITLRQCMDDFFETKFKLKENTVKNYKSTTHQYLSDWLDKPLISISRDDIEKRHREISLKFPTRANTTMRILRAFFEYAHAKYEDEDGNPTVLHNPVRRLTHTKSWNKESRRDTYIKSMDLPLWWEAINTAPEWLDSTDPELIRDYMKLIILTGLRRTEAASIKWQYIDFDHKTLTIPGTETKNGHTHSLPLSDALYSLFMSRHPNESYFVFPGKGSTGHFKEPKKPIYKIREKSGVYFTLHDLRRTFITMANNIGVRDYTLKRLVNHRNTNDVTDGYIVTDIEQLREPMQLITDHIIKTATVIQENAK